MCVIFASGHQSIHDFSELHVFEIICFSRIPCVQRTSQEKMHFVLRFLSRHFHRVLGGVGRNGKVYFSAIDVGLVLGQTLGWAEAVASCQWKDILPECDPLFASEWVIEQYALEQLLRFRRLTLPSSEVEQTFLQVLNLRHFRQVHTDHDLIQLEECTVHEGKPFPIWRNEFRISVLQPAQWLLDVGVPF